MKIIYTLDGTDRYEMEVSKDSELYRLILDRVDYYSITEENDG